MSEQLNEQQIMSKWSADSARGAQFIAPKREQLLRELRNAADVAMNDIDASEKEMLQKIKKEASEKRVKINKTVADMESMDPMRLIRKFWNEDPSKLWMHFLGDQTKFKGEA